MIDAVVTMIISWSMFLLFITAGIHKLTDRTSFVDSLNDYQLAPPRMIPLLSFAVPVCEISLAPLWVLSLIPAVTTIVSALLLGTYTLAITINLARGRTHIDCGCNFSAAGDAGSIISPALVLRNSVLITAILFTLLPAFERDLNWLDYGTVVLATLVATLFYISISQLMANNTAIASWRN